MAKGHEAWLHPNETCAEYAARMLPFDRWIAERVRELHAAKTTEKQFADRAGGDK